MIAGYYSSEESGLKLHLGLTGRTGNITQGHTEQKWDMLSSYRPQQELCTLGPQDNKAGNWDKCIQQMVYIYATSAQDAAI